MRKLYILFVLIFGFSATGQTINIPDANFKAALLLNNLDTNTDGEIQQSEANAISYMYLNNQNIASLEGIQYFTNLIFLDCTGNLLTILDLTGNTALHQLVCANNLLTELHVSNNLVSLECQHNQLTALTLGNSSIARLNISYNQLSNIQLPLITTPSNEGYLNISGNLYTQITIPPNSKITEFYCAETQLTSLDLSGIQEFQGSDRVMLIHDNQNLQSLNLKNGHIEFCVPGNCPFGVYNNPSLQFVCTDDIGYYNNDFTQYMSETQFYQTTTVAASSYCSFTPGGAYNTVTGNIRLDLNSNGCDLADSPSGNVAIGITSGSATLGNTFTNTLGDFTVYMSDQNTLTPSFQNPYFSVVPSSFDASFSGFGNTQTANFCIVPNGVHYDIAISLLPIVAARPGFDAIYKIVYENKGNQVQSGTVSLNFDDSLVDFVSANPTVASQNQDVLSWNFTNLQPFESREITFTINVNSPTETPPVNIGNLLAYNAQISAVETDETISDNLAFLTQTVVGSLDPNDKIVAEPAMNLDHLDDLHYIIHFQNTGTAAAENVVVKDMLPANVDLATLEMISASHPYRSTLTHGNQLEFFFKNINLPDATTNEPGSHGYVAFKIKPSATVVLNNTVENNANIYFDYNLPIVTNTATTGFVQLGTTHFNICDNVTLFPNPAKHLLNINANASIQLKSVSIYNMLGQLVKSTPDFDGNPIDVSDLKTGTYFVEVISDKGKISKKLMKL